MSGVSGDPESWVKAELSTSRLGGQNWRDQFMVGMERKDTNAINK